MTEETTKKKIHGFRILNAILVFAFFFGGGFLFIVATLGITEILFIPFCIVNVLLAFFYERYKQNGTMMVPMIVSRCLAILMTVIIFGSPLIGAFFRDEKSMYFLKREVFIFGVRPNASDVLPKKLPKDISDYYFRTGLQFPAQDYHPYADLMFRCELDSFDYFAEYVEKNGLEKCVPEGTLEEALEPYSENWADYESMMNDKEQIACIVSRYASVPLNLLCRLEFDDMMEFSRNAVVYNGYNSGCAFDRSTGYVIIWG